MGDQSTPRSSSNDRKYRGEHGRKVSAQAMAQKECERIEAARKPDDAEIQNVIDSVPRGRGNHAEDFTVERLHFASGDGCDCSLYFSNDRRIRLCHKYGPQVGAPLKQLRRLSVTEEGLVRSKTLRRKGWKNAAIIKALEREHLLIGAAAPGSGGRLLELRGDRWFHRSRGGPVDAPKMTQYQLDLIHTAARTGNNGIMKACYEFAMKYPNRNAVVRRPGHPPAPPRTAAGLGRSNRVEGRQ